MPHGHDLLFVQDALSAATVPLAAAPSSVSERHRHRPPAFFTEEVIGQIMAATLDNISAFERGVPVPNPIPLPLPLPLPPAAADGGG
ncbi:hypothetical protein HEP73_01330 [Xanthomonas sp. GW]|uniref:hypothetical protein n=1 Tax=Xanthomonas sp. GW TaxID=2724121 RepID=UPI00185FE805|nr:hypothetical protein [Xanthomonas sp. GW]QNH20430.1 hypothetical protein HEP73_01330 [Xanthomonas sp. GW]